MSAGFALKDVGIIWFYSSKTLYRIQVEDIDPSCSLHLIGCFAEIKAADRFVLVKSNGKTILYNITRGITIRVLQGTNFGPGWRKIWKKLFSLVAAGSTAKKWKLAPQFVTLVPRVSPPLLDRWCWDQR